MSDANSHKTNEITDFADIKFIRRYILNAFSLNLLDNEHVLKLVIYNTTNCRLKCAFSHILDNDTIDWLGFMTVKGKQLVSSCSDFSKQMKNVRCGFTFICGNRSKSAGDHTIMPFFFYFPNKSNSRTLTAADTYLHHAFY